MMCIYMTHIVGGSLEVKLLTLWTDEKTKMGRVREESQKRKSEKRRAEKKIFEEKFRRKQIKERKSAKEDAAAPQNGKVAQHCVFPTICS